MVSGSLMMTAGGDPPPKRIKASGRSHKKAKIALATPAASRRSPHTPALEDVSSSSLFVNDETTTDALVPLDAPEATSHAPITTEATDPVPTTESDVVATTEAIRPSAFSFDGESEDAVILSPADSERQYCCDPFTAYKRGIWRPGDGDGDESTDYHDRIGPALPLEERWHLYQSNGGKVSKANMPPKHVILDDLAAWEILESDIARREILRLWPHDFAGTGTIRHRRPHRGRAAINDSGAEGDLKYHFALQGMRKERYYFTGARDYKPVIYRIEAAPTEPEPARKRKVSPSSREPENLKKHGHNQYTPKDQMVKYGAPSKNKGKARYRERLNTFLHKDPKPDWRGLYGTAGYHARKAKAKRALQGGMGGTVEAGEGAEPTSAEVVEVELEEVEGGMWITQDEPGRVLGEVSKEDEPYQSLGRSSSPAEKVDMSDDDEAQEHDSNTPAQKGSRGRSVNPAEIVDVSGDNEAQDHNDNAQTRNLLSNGIDKSIDSGSYALQLEEQVRQAQRRIQALTSSLTVAEGKVEGLETEVAALRTALMGGTAGNER
ncbi:hypothetical protein B0A55_06277 [Friedmanniomyces simplex]|uniref:Uncharacterized protein n=1 Tax=Friedmanniomyces simplex TaxID=329884 RepID=A0A4U0XB45_9PEZI|nr:hypothetical protein B0A55_06277 [Friedmanniomyces simplex]